MFYRTNVYFDRVEKIQSHTYIYILFRFHNSFKLFSCHTGISEDRFIEPDRVDYSNSVWKQRNPVERCPSNESL